MATKKSGSVKKTDTLLTTSVTLSSEVTGTLSVANGGTGQSTFTDGQILVGVTTGNTLSKVSVSGDATLSNAGVLTIANSAVTNAKLANASVTIGSTSVALGATAATIAGLTLTTPNLGTPSAATLTNATGLPISTGVSGLGAGVATFLATPSSANLASAVIGETGSGALMFGTSPTSTNATTNQAANNADALTSIRFTDTSPTGNFLRFRNAANSSDLFAVSVAGTITSGTWNGAVIGSAYGGAGSVNGVLKANGSGTVSAASSGTDYAPATSGTSILKGNGSGGFSNAASGTDYAPATSGSSILYGNGSGGFSNVTIGSGLSFSSGTLSATGGTPAWSSLTDPSGSLSLSMGTNLTTLTWGTGTSTNNLFTLKDTTGNTGTGYVLSVENAGTSTAKPFRVLSNTSGGGGIEVRNDGLLYATGSGGVSATALTAGTVPLARLSGITNTEISASAAIAYSKLSLTTSIVNADISGSAAIAYSKLNLATSIVNADIATSAAIARSKVAAGTASHVVINDGSGNLSSEASLAVSRGGTGQTSYTDGQLLIGNSTGNTLSKATLTAGTNVAITNGGGSITINALTATQTANTIFAGPTSGGASAPTFRALVAADISNGLLTHSKLTVPYVEAEASSSQTISNATGTYIDLQTEITDNDTMHSTVSNTSRLTATTAGKYVVVGTVCYNPLSASGRIISRIYKNRTTVLASIDQDSVSGSYPSSNLTALVDLAATDYVELYTYQTTGSSVGLYNDSTLKARMSMARIA